MTLVPNDKSALVQEQNYQREIVDLGLKKVGLENEVEVKRGEVNDLDSKRAEIQKKKEDLEENILVLEVKHDTNIGNFEKEIAEAKSLLGGVNQELEKLDIEKRYQESVVGDLAGQITDLEKQIEKKRIEMNELVQVKTQELKGIGNEIVAQTRVLDGLKKDTAVAVAKLEQTEKDDEAIKVQQKNEWDLINSQKADIEIWKKRLTPAFQKLTGFEGELKL